MALKISTLPTFTEPFSQHQQHKSPLGTASVDQIVKGRIVAKLQMTGDSFQLSSGQPKVAKKFMYLDLGGSEMGAGSGYFDKTNLRGFYIEKLVYSAWLQRAGDKPDPDNASPNWSIQTEQPESANQSGSISSSLSYTVNGSAGFFGETPTANIGGGATFGSSTSHTITDFTFSQRSDARVLRHEIVMSSARDGTVYRQWSDLADHSAPNVIKAQPNLREVPIQALSNLPIPGQAVWMNDNDAGLGEKLVLHIAVTPLWQIVEGVPGDGSLVMAGIQGLFTPFAGPQAMVDAMPHYLHIALGGALTYQIPIDLSLV
jgi:hypothetical protein